MLIYYLLLFSSAFIFSFQFFITKLYQKLMGTKIEGSIILSCIAYFFVFLIFCGKASIEQGKIWFEYSFFTMAISFGVALSAFSCLYLSIKVLKEGDMNIYSMFMMLGSMFMPTLVGIIAYNEDFTLTKFLALFLIFVSIILSIDFLGKNKLNIKVLLCYLGVFVLNGMVGVLFTIHQNHPELTAGALLIDGEYIVNNNALMTWVGISTFIFSLILIAFFNLSNKLKRCQSTNNRIQKNNNKFLICLYVLLLSFIYGLCNGFGDYFISIATQPGALGASITFPIIDGGTILFSTLIGIIFLKEKISLKKIFSFLTIISSTILFMFF